MRRSTFKFHPVVPKLALSAAIAVICGPAFAQDAPAGWEAEREALLARLAALEERLNTLETTAVISDPETRVQKVQVYVDANGNEYNAPTAGAEPVTTYQRQRVFRRQTISEKIEEALADQEAGSVALGINTAAVTQFVQQTGGPDNPADGQAYTLASADVTFAANLAQNTSLFVDVVGLSGSPPDSEVGGLTLLNGYAARLVRQNEVSLREAWLNTEVFDQTLSLSAGRLDLTAFFDRNAVANDETSQFISDALVNNPLLGLSSNGAGVAAVFDPRKSVNFKIGFQQSDPNALNLSDSMFGLAEVGFRATPSFLGGEGNYRLWYRSDNGTGDRQNAVGVSIDQKLGPMVTAFARYGTAEAGADDDRYYSAGLQFSNNLAFNRLDVWGVGYARNDLASDDKEDLFELYYNFQMSEKLFISPHFQYVQESPAFGDSLDYFVTGIRLQAGL